MVAQKTVTIDLRELAAVKIVCGGCKAGFEVPVSISGRVAIVRCPMCGKYFEQAVLGALEDVLEGLGRLRREQGDLLSTVVVIE
jgi:transcription elongation factor Elf1